MKVRLKVHLTGTRNGMEWPAYNEEIELPDQEAQDMIAAGMAEAVDKQAAKAAASEPSRALVPTRTLKGGSPK